MSNLRKFASKSAWGFICATLLVTLALFGCGTSSNSTLDVTNGSLGLITAFADAGGGNVSVTSTNTLAPGDTIVISGTTSYNGTFTVVSATPASFTITANFDSAPQTGTWALQTNPPLEGLITAFADGGGGTVTVTSANTLATGDVIAITGSKSYNGYYAIVSATPTAFTITAAFDGTAQTGAWARQTLPPGGGLITAFADAGGGTVTVTSANSLSAGTIVIIGGTTSYNGTFTVQSATPTAFTITASFDATPQTGIWQPGGGLIAGCTTQGATSAITLPDMTTVPARFTGVAPLAVFFDATGTTATATSQPFHELEYRWNFDDDDTLTWAYGAHAHAGDNSILKKKNRAMGPVAAHVYETPGTYIVALSVTDGSNTVSNSCVQIAVQDPNIVYSGTNTVCISGVADPVPGSGGCPAGADHHLQPAFDTAINSYLGAGKRVLFNGGETYTINSTIQLNSTGPWTMGGYGTGKARVTFASNPSGNIALMFIVNHNVGTTLYDGRIMDMEFDGQSDYYAQGFKSNGGFDQLTFLRVHLHDLGMVFNFTADVLNFFDTAWNTPYHIFDQLALVDSEIDSPANGGAGSGAFNEPMFFAAERFMYMGNYVHDMQTGLHPTRLQYASRFVISNNFIGDAPGKDDPWGSGLENLKIVSPGNDINDGQRFFPYVTGTTKYTSFGVIGDNEFRITGDSAIASDGATASSRLQDLIVERNWMYFQSPTTNVSGAIIRNGFDNVTYRNNIADGTTDVRAALFFTLNANTNINIYSNTLFSNSSDPRGVDVVYFPVPNTVGNLTVANNLAYAPNKPNNGQFMIQGTPSVGVLTAINNTLDHQFVTDNPGFAASPPVAPADYKPSSSFAVGIGAVVPVYSDFFPTDWPTPLQPTLQPTPRDIGAVNH